MKGFIRKAVLSCAAAAGGVGCYGYRDLVDPCYPQRYNHAAQMEVKAALAPQVLNGHVLDQTVWNYHFEQDEGGIGTDKLTAGGRENLARLARTRPQPDPVIYLQTAQDAAAYDPAKPDEFAEGRSKLDAKRIEAIQKFLNAQTAGHGYAFQVHVHDPAEVGGSAQPVITVMQQMNSNYRGRLTTSGASATGGAGASAGGR